jgi:hypothetical protein
MEEIKIDQLYHRLLPRMEVLEQERILLSDKFAKLQKICIGLAIVLVIVIGYIMGAFWGLLLGAVLGITIYTLMYHWMIADYRRNYKTKVFHELIEELGSNYQYTMDGKLEEELLKKSGIFHEFNKVKCEDLIEGNFDNYSFKLAETNLWIDTVRNEKHTHSGGAYSYIFKGLFFMGKIQFEFPTPIWIFSKEHPKVHPVSRVKDGWEKVKVNHSTFRLHYDIFSQNKDLATQVMQDGILDVILETKEKVVDKNMRLELSFQQNVVFLSISTLKELFEPPVKTPVTDKKDFSANFKYLVNTTHLLQQLTLVKP